jgi:hypothetical protein
VGDGFFISVGVRGGNFCYKLVDEGVVVGLVEEILVVYGVVGVLALGMVHRHWGGIFI